MSTQIQNLLDHALGDGARAAKFEVQVIMPSASSFTDTQAMTTVAKTASFPSKAHEMIPLKYKGRTIPVRGQTRYTQAWDVTFYMHEDHGIKRAIEEWVEAIDQKHNFDTPGALGTSGLQSEFASSSYVRPIIVHQKNFNLDESVTIYTLHNCMPVAVTPVELSAESTGAVLEFTVTFAYTHYLINSASGAGGLGSGVDFLGGVEGYVQQLANDAIGAAQAVLDNTISNVLFDVQSVVDSTINNVTSEITGAVSGVIDGLYQSLF